MNVNLASQLSELAYLNNRVLFQLGESIFNRRNLHTEFSSSIKEIPPPLNIPILKIAASKVPSSAFGNHCMRVYFIKNQISTRGVSSHRSEVQEGVWWVPEMGILQLITVKVLGSLAKLRGLAHRQIDQEYWSDCGGARSDRPDHVWPTFPRIFYMILWANDETVFIGKFSLTGCNAFRSWKRNEA